MHSFIWDTGYYSRHSFLGRRQNRNVIYSAAFNFGLMTFLAVACFSAYESLIHFFCSHIWMSIWLHCTTAHQSVAKVIHVEKAQTIFWNVAMSNEKGSQHAPLLKLFMCLFGTVWWSITDYFSRIHEKPQS